MEREGDSVCVFVFVWCGACMVACVHVCVWRGVCVCMLWCVRGGVCTHMHVSRHGGTLHCEEAPGGEAERESTCHRSCTISELRPHI